MQYGYSQLILKLTSIVNISQENQEIWDLTALHRFQVGNNTVEAL